MQREAGGGSPVPYNLTIYKVAPAPCRAVQGIRSHRLPRSWVRWLLTHPVPLTFLAWAATTAVPDEMVVPTLARVTSSRLQGGRWVVEQGGGTGHPSHLQHWAPHQECRGDLDRP